MSISQEEDWEYWNTRAVDLWHDQTGSVAASATKWSALMGALLGVFGTVAFAGGLTALAELDEPWSWVIRAITTAAVVTAVVSVVLLGTAAGGLRIDSVDAPLDGMEVKRRALAGARTSRRFLRLGQKFAAGTAALVLLGSLLLLWLGGVQDPPAPASYVAVFEEGTACGPLLAAGDAFAVGGRTLDATLRDLVPVASCPAVTR